jgi:predicted TIM-barrel fold metal-dependent hydrolase
MTAQTPQPLLVDTHAHVYLMRMPLADGAWHRPPRDASVEDYVATLERHGVGHAVLAAASLYGDYSDYTLEALARFPQLRATVIVQPDVAPSRLRQLDARGVVGIRFHCRGLAKVPDLSSAGYRTLLGHVADLGWHVHVHDDAPRLATHLRHLEAAGVNIVVDHFGRADPLHGIACEGFQALLASIERGRTWVKLSAAFRLESPQAAQAYARDLLRHAGTDRLFWGSDWPFAAFEDRTSYGQALVDFERCVPHADDRQKIGESAMRFYFGAGRDVL